MSPGRRKSVAKVLLTAAQIAKILQVSEAHVYVLAKRGELPSVRFGRVVRFDGDEVDAFIEAHKTAGKVRT
jgi:excisionase family DNA binding protein